MRITTQLIDARSDEHIWSETYDRDYTAAEVFNVQSDVARRIADALQATLSPETRQRIATRPTENIQAYDLYLQARDHIRRAARDDRHAAVELLRKAVALDPRFALGFAYLSISEAALFWYGDDRRNERVELARKAVEQALALDPGLPEGHMALGYYHYWGRRDYTRALEELRLAEAGLPGSVELIVLRAAVRRRQGDFEGAVADFEHSFELDPRSQARGNNLGQTLWAVERFEDALRAFDRAIELAPTEPGGYGNKARTYLLWKNDLATARRVLDGAHASVDSTRLWQDHWSLELLARRPATALEWALRAPSDVIATQYGGVPRAYFVAEAYHRMGRTREARAGFDSARVVLEQMVADQPENETAPGNLAWVYARLGRKEDAIRLGRRSVQLMPVSRDAFIGPGFVRELAAVYAAVGERNAALEQLESLTASQGRYRLLQFDPVWDPIRDDPRFRALANK